MEGANRQSDQSLDHILRVTVVVHSYFLSKCSVRALCCMYGEEDGELF